ncbi:MAG: TIGR04438 family Trp-rich protein [Burkholderiales bacterium]|jgi:small Trp-rich protein
MALLWIGVLLVLLRWFEVGPFAGLSWWWVLAPLGLAFLWFEAFERIFGFDRRQVDQMESERRRKERVAAQFAPPGAKNGRR